MFGNSYPQGLVTNRGVAGSTNEAVFGHLPERLGTVLQREQISHSTHGVEKMRRAPGECYALCIEALDTEQKLNWMSSQRNKDLSRQSMIV